MKYTNQPGLLRFLKNIIRLIVVLIVVDFLVGTWLGHLYFTEKYNSLTYDIYSAKQDVLVFGSSRALRHYVPSVFENKLNTTFYNCGHDGCYMIFNFAIISAVLERYAPKQVIIDIHPNDLCKKEEDKLSLLLPYHDNAAINNFIKYNGKFENYMMLSKMYPYNSLLGSIVLNHLSSRRVRYADSSGYIKFSSVMPFSKKEVYETGVIDTERVEILNSCLMDLSKKNIKVNVVISPIYFSFSNNDPRALTVRSICQKYKNVRFFNYENDPGFSDYRLFNDPLHLNDAGAHKFSADLAERMKAN